MVTTYSINKIESLIWHPRLERVWSNIQLVHGMHVNEETKKGFLVYGASGVGKTYALKTFAKQFKPKTLQTCTTKPVLYHRFKTGKKSVDDICKLLIHELGVTPPKGRTEPYELHEQLVSLIKDRQVELIILDEVQQVLPKTDCRKTQDILKYFCALLDELPCSIVFSGSESAKRLITYGQTQSSDDDDEQLSRRLLRPVKLELMPPKKQEWVDCVNWYMRKVALPELTIPDDKSLFDRIYIAYLERGFSTLTDLFLQDNVSVAKDKVSLIKALSDNHQIYCKSDFNPFNTLYSDDEINAEIADIKLHLTS